MTSIMVSWPVSWWPARQQSQRFVMGGNHRNDVPGHHG